MGIRSFPRGVYFIISVSTPFRAHIHGQSEAPEKSFVQLQGKQILVIIKFRNMKLIYKKIIKSRQNHGKSVGGQCQPCLKPNLSCIPKSCVLFAPSAGHTAIAEDKRTLPAHPKHSPKCRVLVL